MLLFETKISSNLLLSLLFASCLLYGASSEPVLPEIRTSVDYNLMESVKYSLLEPLVVNNLTGLSINYTFLYNNTASEPSGYKQIVANFSQPTIKNISMDWNATHFLQLDEDSNTRVVMQDLSLEASINYNITTYFGVFEGTATLYLNGLTMNMTMACLPGPFGGAYLSILKASTSNRGFSLRFSQWYLNYLLQMGTFSFNFLAQDFVNTAISGLLTGYVNEQLRAQTQNGIQFTVGNFTTTIKLSGVPEVKTYGENRTFVNMGLSVYFFNIKTGEAAPRDFKQALPEHDNNDGHFQGFISANLLNQFFWMALQADVIHAVVDDSQVPPGTAIGLTTGKIAQLFPQLQQKYGANKGIYLQVDQCSLTAPQFIRSGRMISVLPIELTFWVDTDSTQYPQQGFANCTTCEIGIKFNMTMMFSVSLFTPNSTTIGFNLMSAEVVELHLLGGQDIFNEDNLKSLLNGLMGAMLPTVTSNFLKGIPNPLIGQYGISGMTLKTGKNFLEFGIAMENSTAALSTVSSNKDEQDTMAQDFLY